MFVIGLAYRGTGNNGAIQKLLHFAVSGALRQRAARLQQGAWFDRACPRTAHSSAPPSLPPPRRLG